MRALEKNLKVILILILFMSVVSDWKEAKYQEKLTQIFQIIGTDFYTFLSEISEKRKLPKLNKDIDEKIGEIVKREHPSFSGEEGSRPDIYLETNKGNILIFELKPGADFNPAQLQNHHNNMEEWMEEEENIGKNYLGCVGIFNRDSERDNLDFDEQNMFWIGWDSVYKALNELKIQILDSKLRNDIDRILSETPVIRLNDVLKQQLLRESKKENLFNTIKISVLVIEFMDQLNHQMNLEQILKRYEKIEGNESNKILSDKVSVLYESLKRTIDGVYKIKDYCAKIEVDEYSSWIRMILKNYRGGIDIEFKPLTIQAKDYLILRLWMQSGSKYSMLKPLVKLFHEKLEKFKEFEKILVENDVNWYCKFGSADPINVTKENMKIIEQRQFLPIYCEKKIYVFNKGQDEILSEISETIPILVDVYSTLLELADL